jgi:hypothetical protein
MVKRKRDESAKADKKIKRPARDEPAFCVVAIRTA